VLAGARGSRQLRMRMALLRFAQLGFGTILGKELPDIPPHDLVTAGLNRLLKDAAAFPSE
jgi:hypothetical protein